ncbi:hypothetical protein [uncultured Desulfobacter sp.]|uniref:type II secretion system protein GspD n=1 Tax=uncultured Desulfobacter sp. TaxID=240139 RepID=UPI002AA91CF1|nr:hypothetical protein [uncultured Desulfobacter sp.]
MKYFYLTMTLFFCAGCAQSSFKVPVYNEHKPFDIHRNTSTVKEVVVKDFIKFDDDLDKIPDDIKVSINLTAPVPLCDFFQILIDQGINIVADIGCYIEQTTETKDAVNPGTGDKETPRLQTVSMPAYHGTLKTLLQSLQISHGLFFKYKQGVLIIRKTSPAYVKVLMPGTQENLIKLLNSFGVQDSFYDELSSRIVFNTDYYTYLTVYDYFKNNPYLTLVVFDIMILEAQDSHTYKHGIDWSQLAASLTDLYEDPLKFSVTGSDDGFALNLGAGHLSLQSVVESLDELKDFTVLQSARISVMNGSTAELDVSEKIPYVKEITVSSIDGATDTVAQGYEFDTVSSGLILKLKPSVSGNIISTQFTGNIQSLIEFLEVGTEPNLVRQPQISIRKIDNQIVFRAGETTLIGGLKYNKGSVSRSSLSWLKMGLDNQETTQFSVSILINSEVIRYVFS